MCREFSGTCCRLGILHRDRLSNQSGKARVITIP